MIFVAKRYAQRVSVWDLMTCGSDGMDITQVSGDSEVRMSNACLTTDGDYALYMEGATAHMTRLSDCEDTEIGHVDGASNRDYYRGMRSWDGRYYFAQVTKNDRVLMIRWDLTTGDQAVVTESDGINHPKVAPGGPEITYSVGTTQADGTMTKVGVSFHCETLEPIEVNFPQGPHPTAHKNWLGKTGWYHSTFKPPGRCVQILPRDGEKRPSSPRALIFGTQGRQTTVSGLSLTATGPMRVCG